MQVEIKVPEVGESVQEAILVQWFKKDGDRVAKDEILFLLETDKVTLEVSAQVEGILTIRVQEGERVAIGAVVGTLQTETAAPGLAAASTEGPVRQPALEPAPPATRTTGKLLAGPAVSKMMEDRGIDPLQVTGTGPAGRITRNDVSLVLERAAQGRQESASGEQAGGLVRVEPLPAPPPQARLDASLPPEIAPAAGRSTAVPDAGEEPVVRKPMSPIRRRIAEHLLDARRNTAMLTTFNEIDMSRVQALRARFKQAFHDRYGVSLGIMSFFIKASVAALKEFPEVNAFIEGDQIVYHHYYHVGVAVGAKRGLVVPVIRHADRLSFADLERAIVDFVKKTDENRLDLSDLQGGTFTISNGGVFGSLLSTPILNYPQSGILGLHKIEERPVVVEGQIVIRPMMYVALSYDHRIIDGREAVTFVRRIKECMEHPERIMMEI